MADAQQQQQQPENVGGVGNSVVNDLMRVYENLTQSSTPQAAVADASKALSIAYNNSGAPQTVAVPVYQPPPGYTIPPPPTNVYQQQPEAPGKNALHVKANPTPPSVPSHYHTNGAAPVPSVAYQQQPPVGYARAPMPTVTAVPSSDAKHTQRSGEESHTIMRTSSIASRASQGSLQNLHQPPADASSESDKSVGGRARRKRKPAQEVSVTAGGSNGGKKRGKKSKKEDGRWSKRFTWPEDLHRDFVSAIFDVGLKHSSPSTIMEHMPKHEQITTERIKSHLQKYRLHRVKSKKEFISSYEASLRSFQQNQNGGTSTLVSGSGEVAAHLTASTIGKSNTGTSAKDGPASNALAAVSSSDPAHKQMKLHGSQNSGGDSNDSLMLPQLTEAEKGSPIGAAMGYLMGLFFSLKQQLIIQRSLEAAGEKAKGNVIFPTAATSTVPSGGNNIVPNNPTSAATAVAVAAGVEFVAESNIQQSQPQNGVRSNIEVNSMMKREMKNQMALQNKMRALKQQELDKYKTIHDEGINNPHMQSSSVGAPAMDTVGYTSTSEQPPQQPAVQQAPAQGAGEMPGNDMPNGTAREGSGSNNNLLGIENSEDFWHTDVMDDQLFEFLMNS